MKTLKPPRNYEEQIKRLVDDHNIMITDKDYAIQVLQKVNYYRLAGYGIGLMRKDDPEKYIDGISLEHLYRLHEFDSVFRNELILVIESLEIRLRTQIAYQLAMHYGSEGYVKRDNFNDKRTKSGASIHSMIIDNFRKECERQKNVPFVKHHIENYDGHFPVWVAVELFSFGNLSSLYSIMKPEDQKAVAAYFSTSPKYLMSWILALVEVRNICAHYNRLYNMPLKQRPKLYKEYKRFQTGTLNKVFPVLLIIRRMCQDDPVWMDFLRASSTTINSYSDVIKLSFMGMPSDWLKILS